MRSRSLVKLAAIVVAALISARLQAGDDLVIPLKFIPTSSPGKIAATLREGISGKPIAMAVEDVRQVKSRDLIGEGTGAKDDTFPIRYAGHLPSYVKNVVQGRFATWGVQSDDASNLVLLMKITRFHVLETHTFFGSTFTAEVQLPWMLVDRAGHVFASGTAMGTGKTKGLWRNPVNCEEVLADALLKAAAIVAGDAKLQEAWLEAVPEPAPAIVAVKAAPVAPAASVKTPAQLLADVTKLRHQQMGTRLLVDYVSKQSLASPFSANDLVAWKKAGVPEPVMEAALRRAP